MQTQTLDPNVQALVLGLLSLVVMAAAPIIGFIFNRIFKSIDDLKQDAREAVAAAKADSRLMITDAKADAKALVVDEERRRGEAIGGVYATVNQQYTDLKNEMHNIRTDIKELSRDAT